MKVFKDFQPETGNGKSIPPPLHFVKIYFDQKGRKQTEANAFIEFYSTNKWTAPRGKKIRDWKAAANNWIWNNQQQEKKQKSILKTA